MPEDISPVEVLAAAVWNIGEGYTVADKLVVGRSPFDWIGSDDVHPDDISQRGAYLRYAAEALSYLRQAGWEFRQTTPESDGATRCEHDLDDDNTWRHWAETPDGVEYRIDCGCPCDECREY